MTAWIAACAVKNPPPPADLLKSALTATPVPPAWTGAAPVAGASRPTGFARSAISQLEAIVEEGLRNNLDLQAAASRSDVGGRTGRPGALAALSTALAGRRIRCGRSQRSGRQSRSTASSAEASWELDLWGRVRAQAASATASRQASEADLLYARQSLAATIAKVWYQAITTERLRLTAENGMKVYNELLQLVTVKKTVGKVGQQDVVLAGADLDRARQARARVLVLEAADHARPGARARPLSVRATGPGHRPRGRAATGAGRTAVGAPRAATPISVAAERRVAAAFHAIQSAKAARLPKIALTASGGRSTNDLFYLLGVSPNFWQTGVGLLAPIFTGGQLKAQVEIATAEQRAALALFGQAALRAFSDVETSLANERLLEDQQRYLEARRRTGQRRTAPPSGPLQGGRRRPVERARSAEPPAQRAARSGGRAQRSAGQPDRIASGARGRIYAAPP